MTFEGLAIAGIILVVLLVGTGALLMWAVWAVAARLLRAVGRATGVLPPTSPLMRQCPRSRCGIANPGGARFCRRCGMHLDAVRVPRRETAPRRLAGSRA